MSDKRKEAAPAKARLAERAGAPAAGEPASERAAGGEAAPSDGGRAAGEPMSVSRRTLLIGAGSTAALLGMGALRYLGHNPLCRPPGGQDEAHLVSACIRCERCVEACPKGVIVPAHIEDGLLGMRSPMLDFSSSFCDFCDERNGGDPLCARVCPTRALELPEGATAESVIIGVAVINQKECLAFRDTGCRSCYDACPYEAIELETEGANPHIAVIRDNCNGCGACEAACISLKAGSIASGATERAIVVRPVDVVDGKA